MRSFIICTHQVHQVKANEVGGECSTYGRGEKSVQGFGGSRDHMEDQGVDGKMGSEWILGGLAWGGVDSTGSGQGPVAGCCECGDEPSGSCATELVSYRDES
jgi:hypothetical protein